MNDLRFNAVDALCCRLPPAAIATHSSTHSIRVADASLKRKRRTLVQSDQAKE